MWNALWFLKSVKQPEEESWWSKRPTYFESFSVVVVLVDGVRGDGLTKTGGARDHTSEAK